VEEVLLFNKFFSIDDTSSVAKIQPDKLSDGAQMANLWPFLRPVFSASPHNTFQTCILN